MEYIVYGIVAIVVVAILWSDETVAIIKAIRGK